MDASNPPPHRALSPNCNWPPGPKQPSLLPGQVHIWCADQTNLHPHLTHLRRWLSADEMARASRFAFEHLRHAFAANRGLLRLLLSRYVEALPEQLKFAYNEQGKPSLDFPPTAPPLHFNLSHSGQVMLVAVTLTHPPGVDVEAERPMPDAYKLARRFFAPAEAQRVKETPPPHQPRTFFQHWVQKEAFIKAIGQGLSFPTTQFEVLIAPDAPPRLSSIKGETAAAIGWSLAELHPAPGYIGGLAVKMAQPQISCWRVPVESWVAGSLKR